MLPPDKPLRDVSQGALKMRRWRERRKAGTAAYEFKCSVCGSVGTSGHPQTICCDGCRGEARQRYARKRTGSVAIGTPFNCRQCGTQVVKAHKRHFYCDDCRKLSESETFPHQLGRKRAWFAKYGRDRRAADPAFAMKARMSAGISNSLRDGKNGRSWERLVGFTASDLVRHLERQFLPGMTWGNRGDWHIDHIVPLASFKFEAPDDPEFRAAWALSNLRPLWALDNIRKNDTRTHLL